MDNDRKYYRIDFLEPTGCPKWTCGAKIAIFRLIIDFLCCCFKEKPFLENPFNEDTLHIFLMMDNDTKNQNDRFSRTSRVSKMGLKQFAKAIIVLKIYILTPESPFLIPCWFQKIDNFDFFCVIIHHDMFQVSLFKQCLVPSCHAQCLVPSCHTKCLVSAFNTQCQQIEINLSFQCFTRKTILILARWEDH